MCGHGCTNLKHKPPIPYNIGRARVSALQVRDARAAQAAASATIAKLERQYIEERNLRREVTCAECHPDATAGSFISCHALSQSWIVMSTYLAVGVDN